MAVLIFKQSYYYQSSATMLWQVSTVIIAEKEIIALSSGPEAVSAHPSHDPHHPNPYSRPASFHLYYTGWELSVHLQHIKNWMIFVPAFLKVKVGQHQQYSQDHLS